MTTSIKQFCDFCGVDITSSYQQIAIECFDKNFKYNIRTTKDACEECYKIKLGQLEEIMLLKEEK